MSGQKHKARKTRKQLEKERLITKILKGFCWLVVFCLIVSLIKIATVLAIKGNDPTYASDMSLTYIRIIIAVHAIMALLAILSRNHFIMIATIILSVAFFIYVFRTPIYAETAECVSVPEKTCQYSLIYIERNIYNY